MSVDQHLSVTMSSERQFGICGLGRMGGGLALNALERGFDVVGFTRNAAKPELLKAGLREVSSLQDLVRTLTPPRRVFLYVPAGPMTDNLLAQLGDMLDAGDILVDGGNSYWGDSIRRAAALAERGVSLVDLGTSGGLEGARHGACFMAGGDPAAVGSVERICREIAVEGGFVNAGSSGSGHYAKLVHNGIEFGMLQAIGEGVQLLERFDHKLPVGAILECWRHGSVVRSWLVDLLAKSYADQGGLGGTGTFIEDTGEVNWLVSDAMRLDVPVPVITLAIMQIIASRDEHRDGDRAIVQMRHGFGAHPLGPDEAVATERREGRVGDIFRPDRDRPLARPASSPDQTQALG